MSESAELEADIQRAFPKEYTPDNWQDLIVRFIEQEMPKDVDLLDEYEQAAKQYIESIDLGEPPEKPFPNYSIIRACNWLNRYQSSAILAYQVYFLRCQLSRYADMDATIKEMREQIRLLKEDQIQVKLDSIPAERPN